jgi:hypothetical protein
MVVLGIDPSLTNYGWALHDPEATPRCIERGRFQTSAKTLFIDRYIELRESLTQLILRTNPDKIGIEFPIFNDIFSEGMYGLFLYSCEAIRTLKKDVVFWSPLQVKSHARETLERPKAWVMQKPDMVEAAKKDVGGGGNWNHNEADAYLIARLSARFWLLQSESISAADLSLVEKKFFLDIKTYTRGKKAGKTELKGVFHREDERFFLWSKEAESDGTTQVSGSRGRDGETGES